MVGSPVDLFMLLAVLLDRVLSSIPFASILFFTEFSVILSISELPSRLGSKPIGSGCSRGVKDTESCWGHVP